MSTSHTDIEVQGAPEALTNATLGRQTTVTSTLDRKTIIISSTEPLDAESLSKVLKSALEDHINDHFSPPTLNVKVTLS